VNQAFFFPGYTNRLRPGDRQHSVFAASWALSRPLRFNLVFDPAADVPAYDRTAWYIAKGQGGRARDADADEVEVEVEVEAAVA